MRLVIPLALLSLAACAQAQAAPATQPNEHGNPIELGDVQWLSYDDGLKRAKAEGKPLLVLFDEVPGCSTVQGYGQSVLKHPLIVEAAETLFVPVLVKNNVGGRDREVLNKYGEPTWNNPVVRIVDGNERALTARVNGDYTAAGLASAMKSALKGKSPRWLDLVVEGRRTERAVFSMYCFWSGEVAFGGLPGVISTRPGFLHGHEVVEVVFDPDKTSFARIAAFASETRAADNVYARSNSQLKVAKAHFKDAKKSSRAVRYSAKDDDYQIRKSAFKKAGLTEHQLTRVNALVGRGQDVKALLSPRQLARLR